MNGKLVRDKIPEIITKDTGKSVSIKVLSQDEYITALHRKLDEEVEEFHQSGDIEELVDILHVVLALAADRGYTTERFVDKCNKKENERGVFTKRYFLCDTDEQKSIEYSRKTSELCNSCRYDLRNDLCCGKRDCLTCEMRDKPESPTHKNGIRGCYCLSINDGDQCKYYTPIKEVSNDRT